MSGEWTEIVLKDCISAIIEFNFGMRMANSFTQDQHPDLCADCMRTSTGSWKALATMPS